MLQSNLVTRIERLFEPVRQLLTPVLSWAALALSLSFGFVAAFPVNVALVNFGVKGGMQNPAEMGRASTGAAD